jgi:hypothetical protein
MKKIIVPFIIIGVTTLIASCHTTVSEDERIGERVDSFATYYFNWQYDKAAEYCTPPSIKWLEFAASQVREGDVEQLKAKESQLTTEIISIDYSPDEQQARVKQRVSNYMEARGFGEPPAKCEEGIYEWTLVKEKRAWLIRMEALPRNEKQNHD